MRASELSIYSVNGGPEFGAGERSCEYQISDFFSKLLGIKDNNIHQCNFSSLFYLLMMVDELLKQKTFINTQEILKSVSKPSSTV